MKKILLSSLIMLTLAGSISNLSAQTAEGIIYQAEARDDRGAVIANQSLIVKVAILTDSFQGTIVWEEQHNITTNSYGAFVLAIGTGEKTTGRFEDINWSGSTHFLNVHVKKDELSGWIDMGTSQFLSVPYAMHAKTASYITGEDPSRGNGPGVPSQNWSLFGNSRSDASKDKLGTTDFTDLVIVTDNLDRLRINDDGNINLAKSLDIGENLTVKQSVYLNTVSGQTINNGPFTVAALSPTLLTGTLTVNEATYLLSTLDVTGATQLLSTLEVTGATDLLNTLDVAGATSLANTLEVTGATDLLSTLEVTGATDLLNTLDVAGATNLQNTLNVTGATGLASTLNVTGATSMASTLNVTGATGLASTLTVSSATELKSTLKTIGTSEFNGQVTVKPSISGASDSYGSYPLRVEGGSQGIAIKVNTTDPNSTNNFITFFNSSGTAKGRIEGQTAINLVTEPEYLFESGILTAEVVAAGVNIGLSLLPNGCAGVGVVACPPEPSVVAIAIAEEILAIANLAAYQLFAFANLGVTYESGSADYAEWLERLNYNEQILPGDIVGLKGGKVTKNTFGVNHFLVASTNPAVLGNMPETGKEDAFTMIAFMGQVPVKVRGSVNIGDYILPSGLNDGTGIPVSPDAITAEQYESIVGIAWSATKVTAGISVINMAIGLHTNDLAKLVKKQSVQIESLQNSMSSIEKRLSNIESGSNSQTQPNKPVIDSKAPAAVEYTINAAEVNHAIMLLKESYIARGIDPSTHAGLNKLFTDDQYRNQIIQEVILNYEKTKHLY